MVNPNAPLSASPAPLTSVLRLNGCRYAGGIVRVAGRGASCGELRCVCEGVGMKEDGADGLGGKVDVASELFKSA